MQNPATFPSRNTLIVVLGMHRSGTSALTRAMNVFGAEFGSHLMPPAPGNNDKGFFEDIDINELDIRLMQEAGMDWHTMAPIELDRLDAGLVAQFETEALALLREKCAQHPILAIKDPRISRLLPFWQRVFAQLEMRVVYLIAIRNPISVSQSLAKRDGLAEEKSYLLWLVHTVPALEMTHGKQRVIINYDRLMDRPRAELAKVSQALDLPMIESRLDAFEHDFLDTGLRHTHHTARDLQTLDTAPAQVKDLFTVLEQIPTGTPAHTLALDAALARAHEYLDNIAPLLRFEWRMEQRLQRLNDALSARDRRVQPDQDEFERLQMLVEQQRAELDRVTHDLNMTLHSTSWRATAFLRALKRRLGSRQPASWEQQATH